MDRKTKIGVVLLILGIPTLVFGIVSYSTLVGIYALSSIGHPYAYRFEFVISLVVLSWGSALLISGVILLVLGFSGFIFNSRKPMVIGIVILMISLAFSGLVLYGAAPPPYRSSVVASTYDNCTEVNSAKPMVYNFSSYSNYPSKDYFNISLGSRVVFRYNFSFNGYDNFTCRVPASVFKQPGEYTSTNLIMGHGTRKVETSSIKVLPYVPVKVSVSGPSIVEPCYTGSYSAFVSGAYGPYSISWIVRGERTREFNGSSISLKFGTYYYGYEVIASAVNKYGVSNSSIEYVTLVHSLSASFTSKYSQLDAGMKDIFNSSVSTICGKTGVSPYSYEWFVDGTQFSSSENASYAFSHSGTYNVSLQVTDSLGNVSHYYQDVKVNSPFYLYIISSARQIKVSYLEFIVTYIVVKGGINRIVRRSVNTDT